MTRYSITCTILQVLVLFGGELSHGECSRILCVCPSPSISHQVVVRGFALALREKGHELVVVTTDPVRDKNLENYTEIDVSFVYGNKEDYDFVKDRGNVHWLELFWSYAPLFQKVTEDILACPEMRKIYAPDSGEKFDLLILEMLYYPAFLSLAERFDVPVVGMASLGLSLSVQYSTGNPVIPSHPSNWELDTRVTGELTFWQRLMNYLLVWKHLYYYRTEYIATQVAIAKKYFGEGIPDLLEMESNVSLTLVNQQKAISYIRPNLPNVIEIGGFHNGKEIKPLPEELRKTLDNATQGFVYMSLGSNVKSNMLTSEARGEFIAAFSKLPYTVLWKFEDDHLPNKPDNVVIMKWTPQQAVLAHPNLKVFIYQGGLQSTEEAISHAVPVIGYPVMVDQELQVNKMVSLGVGKKLEITAVKGDDLLHAIRDITVDGSWKQRMLDLRALLRDKPQDVLEKAIWWTEHVIRHRGASYLRSSFVDEQWYRRQDIDVIYAISSLVLICLILSLGAVYQLLICSGLIPHVFKSRSIGRKKKDN